MTDTVSPLPPWEDTERDYIRLGLPHVVVLQASPSIHLFTEAAAARIGVRFEVPPLEPAPNPSLLEQISTAKVELDGCRYLEISTKSFPLFESFYRLAGQVISTVVAGEPPANALTDAVARWEALVQQVAILPEERQAGLFGELLFFERLRVAGVAEPVLTWVGPDRQAHDFRWGELEFEVKSTSGGARIHTINGLAQLQPSLDCRLFLVSMQLTDAGTGGQSLPELIALIRSGLSDLESQDFNRRLERAGYFDRHAPHYSRRRRLRDKLALIEVGDGVPRLTREAIETLAASFAPARIRNAVYEIDVTGLGHVDGTPEFLAILPSLAEAAQ